ncbi:MAG: hypothetical protein SAL07_01755 [Oscillatoria sp. PMC 1051.18]|nr:hypothetical protein [Oscillatoria sp. PMC 1050.18]MEC5028610.1 hypothetical protein [Oscillatoria sp. PMC 1051.18]
MLRKIIFALVGLNLALLLTLTTTSAQATTTDITTYTWDFARIGSSHLVCQQIVVRPKNQTLPNSDKQAVTIRTSVVSPSYCADLTKPQLDNYN